MPNCQKCGECCKQIQFGCPMPPELSELFTAHYGRSVDAVKIHLKHRCKMLGDDNRCKDYENRPDFCRQFSCPDPTAVMVVVEG